MLWLVRGVDARGDEEDSLAQTVCEIQWWQLFCVCVCVWLHTIATVTRPLFMCPSSFRSLLGIWQRQTTVLQKWAAARCTNRLNKEDGEKAMQSRPVLLFSVWLCPLAWRCEIDLGVLQTCARGYRSTWNETSKKQLLSTISSRSICCCRNNNNILFHY